MLPAPVDLSQLPQNQESITFHAALPSLNGFGGNFSTEEQPDNGARYQMRWHDKPDLYSESKPVGMASLSKTMRLVDDNDALDSYVHFPLTRLRRGEGGGFEVDPQFVAPGVSIQCAPPLIKQLRSIVDALHAKTGALLSHLSEPRTNTIEYRAADISSYWLLHTANTSYATLTHYFHHQRLHPERLFEQMLTLTGALMTFSKHFTLAELPVYRHDDPGPGFSTLHLMIMDLLDTVISRKYLPIPLTQSRATVKQGKLDSGRITAGTVFYLAVQADMPAAKLIEKVPDLFKIGSPEDCNTFIQYALHGVGLVYAPQVPEAIPVRPSTYYFELTRNDEKYEHMIKAQSVFIYVPKYFDNLKFELIALLE
jgi:type VI secretion system protein ImpJ